MTGTDTTLEIIEQLEFELEIHCEHSQHPEGRFGHNGPAYYFIKSVFPCGHGDGPDFLYICKGGYEDTTPIMCWTCEHAYERDECWTIIAKVRS